MASPDRAPGPSAGTRVRILNAAFDRVSEVGLAALTLEDVASSAGVSRQTVYRHFGSREGLVEALILREERWFIDRVVAAADRHRDVGEAIAAGVSAAIVAASEHSLLQRLLRTEPESIVPLVVLGEGPVISAARPVVENLLATRLTVPEQDIVAMADVCSRLLISYVLDPGTEDAQATGRRIAKFVAAALEGKATGEGFRVAPRGSRGGGGARRGG